MKYGIMPMTICWTLLAIVTWLIIEKKLLMRHYQKSLIIEYVIPNLDNIWSYPFNIQTAQ